MARTITNRSKKFAAALTAASFAGFVAAADQLKGLLREVVGEPYNGKASRPGEPPKKRTGRGQDSIESESSEAQQASRVAVRPSGKHMIIHELGRGAKRRPWFKKTLNKSKAQLTKILLGAAKRRMDREGRGGGGGGPERDERGRFISRG